MPPRSDGQRRDCRCPKSRHEHGTRQGYVIDRCRCQPCRDANSAAERARNRAKLYGRYNGLVDAQPAREHVRALMCRGVGIKTICIRSGVGGGVMTKLLYGTPLPDGTRRAPSRRCKPSVRDAILALPLDAPVAPGARVDGTGTARRLRALVAVGWSQAKLAHRLGMAPANFGRTFHADTVLQSTRDAVATLYDELWNTSPIEVTSRDKIAASRARRHARVHGWLPPLAWDDDTIDDPDVNPVQYMHTLISEMGKAEINDVTEFIDEIAVERAIRGDCGQLTLAELSQARDTLERMGLSAREIGERLGMSGRTVQRRRAQERAA